MITRITRVVVSVIALALSIPVASGDAPEVLSVDPVEDATLVPRSTNVTVFFSEPVDGTTVGDTTMDGTPDTFLLIDNVSGSQIPGTVVVAADGLSAVFDPVPALGAGTTYRVSLTLGVLDLQGMPLVPFESYFKAKGGAPGNAKQLSATPPFNTDSGDEVGEAHGSSVAAAGDVNHDGIMDWLVGAPDWNGPGTDRGRVLLYLGTGGTANRSDPDVIFEGVINDGRLGASVAGGEDVTGDGTPDLLFGAPQHDGTTASGPGRAYLVDFDPDDTASYPNLGNQAVTDTVTITAVATTVLIGGSPDDRAGWSVALSPDLNGDGLAECLIGAPGRNVDVNGDGTLDCTVQELESECNVGTAYLVFGSAAQGADEAGSGDSNGGASPENLAFRAGPEFGERAGSARDLGASSAGISGSSGEAGVDATTIDLSDVGEATGTDGVAYTGESGGDLAGFAVAGGGDFDGNLGFELVIGAPGDAIDIDGDGTPDFDVGSGYIIGSEFSRGIIELCRVGAGEAGDPEGIIVRGDETGQELGSSVAMATDFDGDGFDEALIGAPGTSSDAGLSILYYGGTFGDDITGGAVGRGIIELCRIGSGSANDPSGVTYTGLSGGDRLGAAVASVGDVDEDGIGDIGFGAPGFDAPARIDAGAVFVALGSESRVYEGAIAAADLGVNTPGARYEGEAAGDAAGTSLAGVGDATGGGDDDFVIGASSHDEPGLADTGSSYLVEAPPESDTDVPSGTNCGTSGCTVIDLSNGARLVVPPNGLAAETDLSVTGDETSGTTPASGLSLLGAATFAPDGQAFQSPNFPQADIATGTAWDGQLTPGESFDLYYDSGGGSWVDTGLDGTVTANTEYAARFVVRTDLTSQPLRVFAVFIPDLDADGTRDSLDGDVDGDLVPEDDGDGTLDPCTAGNTVDCDDNCAGLSNPGQEDSDGDGSGDACDVCPDENPNDADGDGLCCGAPDADNCCGVSNASQEDGDGDGAGDACDTNPRLLVSSDGADNPDFSTIQAAVDAAVESGTTIEIRPGTGPYVESVTVNRNLLLLFEGNDALAPVVDGTSLAAFDVQSTSGTAPMTFVNLELRGMTGILSSVSINARGCAFDSIGAWALDLGNGTHDVQDVAIGPSSPNGIRLAGTGSLELRRAKIEGHTGIGLELAGPASVYNTLIIGAGSATDRGIVMLSGGTLGMVHSTLLDHDGFGLDNAIVAPVTIDSSVLWNNVSGDMSGVACSSLAWSDTGVPDCTGVNDNISLSPNLDAAACPLAGSPLLDHGPAPSVFLGDPCRDLYGGVRLRDHDGDGMAESDPGVCEAENTTLLPGDVPNLQWLDADTLQWDPASGASEYHVYRGPVSELSYAFFGTCQDFIDGNRADTTLDDAALPPVGDAFYYVITAESGGGEEGTLGLAACVERSNFSPCP